MDDALTTDAESDRCAYCDVLLDDDSDTSIRLELSKTDASWLNEEFCSQDHAARWLDQPLPAFRSAHEWGDEDESGFFVLVGYWLLLLLMCSLIGIGAYQVVTWII